MHRAKGGLDFLMLVVLTLALIQCGNLGKAMRLTQEGLHGGTNKSPVVNYGAASFVSTGFKVTVSHILWFKLNNYFGLHFASDKSYQWLGEMCNTVTSLNPHEEHVFEFCALMLAWEAHQPKEAEEILTKGIDALPNSWRLRMVRGIQSRIFFGNNEAARDDFKAGAQIPNAPDFMSRLAAKTMANLNDPNEAIQFLKQLIQTSKDPAQKAALAEQLQKTQHAVSINALEEACKKYQAKTGSQPQSLSDCIASKVLDPLGAEYSLDPKTQKITSSSKLEPAKLFSKHFSSNKPIESSHVRK
jgi:hypothetical protein